MKKIFLLFFLLGCSSLEVPPHTGAVNDHFDGQQFYNPWQITQPVILPTSSAGLLGFFARRLTRPDRGPWPEWVDIERGLKPVERVTEGVKITFVGHATLIIQTAGLNILTDPVWSYYVGPSKVASIRRYKNPGILFEDLPPIDVVIVSHNHYDHMDVPTLGKIQSLKSNDKTVFIVPTGNSAFLNKQGVKLGRDMDWWETRQVSTKVKVQAVPAQHWSTRMLSDRNRALWAGYVLHTSVRKQVV